MGKKKTTTKADYVKLRHMAYEMVVEQGKTQKEAAASLGISEGTMSEWAMDGNWRALRKTRQSSASTARENITRMISLLSEKRLRLEEDIAQAIDDGDQERELDLRNQAQQISLEMAYQNKSLSELNKEKQVTLGVFVDVFDEIFSALRSYDQDLFDRTIAFQTTYLRRKSNELG